MALMITDREMTSDQTRHTARISDDGGWGVTWLPGRALTHSQAITAMTIAEVLRVQDDALHRDNPMRLHIENWAAELGISGSHAVAEASLSPEDHVMLT